MILANIQQQLKAPKNQENKFAGYMYRSCEDILEALKPLLMSLDCAVVLTDEIVEIGGRVYVKSTATLKTPDGDISSSAYAREAADRKGMDPAQITGAASSYARKYALNGLFAIDDTKDPDGQVPEHNTDKKALSLTELPLEAAFVGEIDSCVNEDVLVNTCKRIKKELGPNYPKYQKSAQNHYRRRLEEIMDIKEGLL